MNWLPNECPFPNKCCSGRCRDGFANRIRKASRRSIRLFGLDMDVGEPVPWASAHADSSYFDVGVAYPTLIMVFL